MAARLSGSSQVVLPENWQENGFALYVHWPFCQAKCPYCDFNSHVVADVDQGIWRDAFTIELEAAAQSTPDRVLTSIFFGGGTPSLMEGRTVSHVIETATRLWRPSNDIEITLEANPTSTDASRFREYRDGGVNRVSLGVQSLSDPDLKALGRLHSADEALAAVDLAQSLFGRVSIDLIYARQHQTEEDWQAELSRAIALGLEHYSLYQLTVEDGTAFGDRFARGRLLGLPDEVRSESLWNITQELCKNAGLGRYEVSNFAKPGQESRHNQVYWRSGDWVGVGPGAHGRITIDGERWSTQSERFPGSWVNKVKSGIATETEKLSLDDWRSEFILMGLRTAEGIDLASHARRFGNLVPLDLSHGLELGVIEMNGDRLRVSEAGILLLNAVIDQVLPD